LSASCPAALVKLGIERLHPRAWPLAGGPPASGAKATMHLRCHICSHPPIGCSHGPIASTSGAVSLDAKLDLSARHHPVMRHSRAKLCSLVGGNCTPRRGEGPNRGARPTVRLFSSSLSSSPLSRHSHARAPFWQTSDTTRPLSRPASSRRSTLGAMSAFAPTCRPA
jgi:hypothetical protein